MTSDALAADEKFHEVRVVFHERSTVLTFNDVLWTIDALRSLVYLCAVAVYNDSEEQRNHRFKLADGTAENSHIRAIEYHSPLMIVFVIGASVSAAAAISNKLLSVWDHYQRSRELKARTDLTLAAYAAIKDQLALSAEDETSLADRLEAAEWVLGHLTTVEIAEPPAA